MSTYRVPKCGRHFVKFDDVTIYPVLVVARTGRVDRGFCELQISSRSTRCISYVKTISVTERCALGRSFDDK